MEWAIGAFFAVMLGLYIWSHLTAGRAIGEKVQPFIDDVFGVRPTTGQNPKIRPPLGRASKNFDE
jgi:hypothetical protein